MTSLRPLINALYPEKIKRLKQIDKMIRIEIGIHDKAFRKKHKDKCKCKRKVDYGKGDWYCEAMQRSRERYLEPYHREHMLNSPYMPEELLKNLKEKEDGNN